MLLLVLLRLRLLLLLLLPEGALLLHTLLVSCPCTTCLLQRLPLLFVLLLHSRRAGLRR